MTRPAMLGAPPAFPNGLPFVRPARPPFGEVAALVQRSYDRGILTNGPLVRDLEEATADRLGVPDVVAVSSCTSGLMLTLQALVPRAAPVILPSFTFSATAHAVVWAGSQPAFAECRVDDCQLDLADAAERLAGAGALVGVHLFGAPCRPMDAEELGHRAGVPVIFDAAHAFGATHRARSVGGFGDAEVFSLSPTKPLVAGEGGLVATIDHELATRIRHGRDYGNPGDYNTRFAGLNARMSELHAAIALAALPYLDDHLVRRRQLAERYRDNLEALPGIRAQRIEAHDMSTFKDFTIIVDETEFGVSRDDVVEALRADGVDTRCYFSPPVHRQTSYQQLPPVDLPVTDSLADRVVCLPIWRDLDDDAVDAVSDVLGRVHEHAEEVREQRKLACVSS